MTIRGQNQQGGALSVKEKWRSVLSCNPQNMDGPKIFLEFLGILPIRDIEVKRQHTVNIGLFWLFLSSSVLVIKFIYD